MGKGEIARNKLFLFSHSVFHLSGDLSDIFNKFEIIVCKLCQCKICHLEKSCNMQSDLSSTTATLHRQKVPLVSYF